MAVLSKDEFFNRIRERIGEDTSDETLTFIEDVTDTYNELEGRAEGDGTDWKAEYDRLDSEWRTRYRDRFWGIEGDRNVDTDVLTPKDVIQSQEDNVSDDGKIRSYETLFEEREG